MSDVRLFSDSNLGMQVRMILHEDGSISINAEDTARGFGFVDESNFRHLLRKLMDIHKEMKECRK